MPEDLFGIPNLTHRLTTILVHLIRDQIPEMKAELTALLASSTTALQALGAAPPQNPQDQLEAFNAIKQRYISLVAGAIKGNYNDQIFSRLPELTLCAQAGNEFKALKKAIDKTKPLFSHPYYLADLKRKIAASRGRELPGF
jgi:hypothetical protein